MKRFEDFMKNVLNESADEAIDKIRKDQHNLWENLKDIAISIFDEDTIKIDNLSKKFRTAIVNKSWKAVHEVGVVFMDEKVCIRYKIDVIYKLYEDTDFPSSKEEAEKELNAMISQMRDKVLKVSKIEHYGNNSSSNKATANVIYSFDSPVAALFNSYMEINKGKISGKKYGL